MPGVMDTLLGTENTAANKKACLGPPYTALWDDK